MFKILISFVLFASISARSTPNYMNNYQENEGSGTIMDSIDHISYGQSSNMLPMMDQGSASGDQYDQKNEEGSGMVLLDEGSGVLLRDVVEGSGIQMDSQVLSEGSGLDTLEGSGIQMDSKVLSEGSGIQMDSQVLNEGSGIHMDSQVLSEGSGLDTLEGSGSEEPNLTFINFHDQSSSASKKEEQHEITVSKDDVDTLLIKVHLPTPSTDDLLEDLRDDTMQETELPEKLDMAVSLTSMLNDILERIQSNSSNE